MRQTRLYPIYVIVILFTFASCRTMKEVQTASKKEIATGQTILKNLLSEPNNPELTSSLTISSDDLTIGGQLRMRWNKSVQISINMMGIMEIARIEILPDHLLLIDRTGKRYCKTTYSDLPYLKSVGIDFYTLQALFWNKAFAPGFSDPRHAIDHIEIASHTAHESIFRTERTEENQEYGYTFTVDAKGSLARTRMATRMEDSIYSFEFDYGSMEKFKHNTTFPSTLDIILRSIGQDIAVRLTLNNISTSKNDWSDESAVGSKYRQVTIDELLEAIK